MFKRRTNGKYVTWPQWNITSMEKTLRHQRNMSSWFIALIEKAWFYERLFEKKYSIKDTMPIKISFMHYMKLTRVMLPVVSKEF